MPVTILIVEQYPVVREGLKAILARQEDWRVIGETGNGLEAVALAERFLPDVLIVNVLVPGLNGIEVTRRVRLLLPHTQVIALSMSAREASLRETLRSGAAAYVLADVSVDALIQTVREVAARQHDLGASLAERLSALQAQSAQEERLAPHEALTRREREVLHLVARGYTNTEMAHALGISPRTVETHRAHLRKKLDLHTQTDLIRYAMQRGILPTQH